MHGVVVVDGRQRHRCGRRQVAGTSMAMPSSVSFLQKRKVRTPTIPRWGSTTVSSIGGTPTPRGSAQRPPVRRSHCRRRRPGVSTREIGRHRLEEQGPVLAERRRAAQPEARGRSRRYLPPRRTRRPAPPPRSTSPSCAMSPRFAPVAASTHAHRDRGREFRYIGSAGVSRSQTRGPPSERKGIRRGPPLRVRAARERGEEEPSGAARAPPPPGRVWKDGGNPWAPSQGWGRPR